MSQPPPPVSIDALELWVGAIGPARHLLSTAFGFQPAGSRAGGERDEAAACLASGDVRVILREGTSPANPVSRHVARHGDTVADVALVCADPAAIAARALAHGLMVSGGPDSAKIDLFGDQTVCHTVRRARLAGGPAPPPARPPVRAIDHVAYCLPWGFAETAARLYEEVFGLHRADADSFDGVGDESTGMRSIVMRSEPGLTVVLTEPAGRVSTGQTQRFVDAHGGPGVQHVALAYDDVLAAVESLRSSGVEFLPVPGGYYEQAQRRLPGLAIEWDTLRRLGILIDADDDGLLLQQFTRPIADRGTFFVEVIQRAGATGFGANNVRALFAAVQAAMSGLPERSGSGEDR
jgi:4-hydroxymandelate synthase